MKRPEVETKFLIPLSQLLNESRWDFTFFCKYVLRRDYVFRGNGDVLPEVERMAWLEWVNHRCMPRNRQMAELVRAYGHLLGKPLPRSFQEFLDYHDWWYEKHMNWMVGKQDPKYHLHSYCNFPKDFEPDVWRIWLERLGKATA
jgi:hypothetical protein